MKRRGLIPANRIAFAALAAIGCVLIALVPAFALAIAPLAALVFALICGRAPGEEILAELRERLARPRHTRHPVASTPALADVPVRTGLRIAFALAMRPPPAHALALN